MKSKPIRDDMIWSAILDVADAVGVSHIRDLPGCWEIDIGDGYKMAVNGHTEPIYSTMVETTVNQFVAYVTFNGWPFAIINPVGGKIGYGTVANKRSFIDALRRKVTAGGGD